MVYLRLSLEKGSVVYEWMGKVKDIYVMYLHVYVYIFNNIFPSFNAQVT